MATPLRAVAEQVSGAVIGECGHFIPDEQPEKLAFQLCCQLAG
jgi:hypothetical protein